MLTMPQYRGTTVGVLGLGPEGRACAAALASSGANVIAWDSRSAVQPGIAARMLAPADWPVDSMAGIFLADGVRGGGSLRLVDRATAAGVPVLNDLDLFADAMETMDPAERPKVIAVTGAAGKSVTCSLIAHILRESGRDAQIGGISGQPVLGLKGPARGCHYILELPVRRLSTSRRLHADISVVLNVSSGDDPDQTELALRSILRIFRSQSATDTAIVGVDDRLGQKIGTLLRSGQLAAGSMGTIVPVSGEAALSNGVYALDGAAYASHRGKTQLIGDFSRAPALVGPHFQRDAAAAIATCRELGLPDQMIVHALQTYRSLPGRFECLGAAGGVQFVDDSFASCSMAAKQAVRSSLDVFWIGGDGIARSDLTDMSKAAVRGAYLVGDGSVGPMQVAAGDRAPLRISRHDRLAEAFACAYDDACGLLREDEHASPMILCSPGVPMGDGRFDDATFRELVSGVIGTEVSRAS